MKSALLSEYIPIGGLIVIVLYPKYISDFLNTYLGKFFIAIIVSIYANYDVLYGLIICLLAISFYELDWREGFDAMTVPLTVPLPPTKNNEVNNEYVVQLLNNTFEPMTTHDSLTEFRDTNCKETELYSRGIRVNPEMAQHIFPQIKYKSGICNVCDPNCNVSVSMNKIAAEERVARSRDSDEWMFVPHEVESKIISYVDPNDAETYLVL